MKKKESRSELNNKTKIIHKQIHLLAVLDSLMKNQAHCNFNS